MTRLGKVRKFWPILVIILVPLAFFWPLFLGRLPIPTDTILGLYHPWRDVVWGNFTAGVPFKNFLITDPLLQQIPWRVQAIDALGRGTLPLWNPYNFAGTPLLANPQVATFFPGNVLFFILPFALAWSTLIVLQPLLTAIFTYLYLRSLRLNQGASLLGALAFSFSGFLVAWMMWGTVVYSALFLPLILLTVEKAREGFRIRWFLTFVIAITLTILGGHWQVTFYTLLTSFFYLLIRLWARQQLVVFLLGFLIGAGFSLPQILPSLEFTASSARGQDLPALPRPDWFLPPPHLIQVLVPDFFGNPATLNYWGVFNYGEFVSYIGVVPLIFSLYALFFRRDKKTFFFAFLLGASLLLALPNPIAQIPYQFRIPLISTSQPSRLIFLIDFSLAILAAMGLDSFIKSEGKWRLFWPLLFTGLLLAGLFLSTVFLRNFFPTNEFTDVITVARRNLILPSSLLFIFSLFTLLYLAASSGLVRGKTILLSSLITLFLVISALDLYRFFTKFTPFTPQHWFYPSTQTIAYLKANAGVHRYLTLDRRILPPNLATYYRLYSPEGYDPLYLRSYGEMVSSWERNLPDPTLSKFNRIVRPTNLDSNFLNLLGVKYVLSFNDLPSAQFRQVFAEGQTKVFENRKVLPRAFLVDRVVAVSSKEKELEMLGDQTIDLAKVATTRADFNFKAQKPVLGQVSFLTYEPNEVILDVWANTESFLVLSDNFYSEWRVKIDDQPGQILPVDYNLRGVEIDEGHHLVRFYYSPESFKAGTQMAVVSLGALLFLLWIKRKSQL